MKAKKMTWEMKCMLLVMPLRLTTTMNFLKISRTSTPQTGRIHLTRVPGMDPCLVIVLPSSTAVFCFPVVLDPGVQRNSQNMNIPST